MHKPRACAGGPDPAALPMGRDEVAETGWTGRMTRIFAGLALALAVATTPLAAQETVTLEAAPEATPEAAAASADAAEAKPEEVPCQPDVGCVTNLPLPRFVSLKGSEGNARRGPGLTHRIDWVFARAGMPLRVTAEFENWRRVEDHEGAGGWVHYTLLSGSRSVLVTLDMAEIRNAPSADATVVAQAELGVIGRLLQCDADWCRVSVEGQRGWVAKSAVWGVGPDETFD